MGIITLTPTLKIECSDELISLFNLPMAHLHFLSFSHEGIPRCGLRSPVRTCDTILKLVP
jgi:hypothetical protein